MNKILISIRPEWVAKILNGEKTIEIRKSMPKCELPCEVYIYCTKRLPPVVDYYDYEEIIKYKESGLLGKVVAKFTMHNCFMTNIFILDFLYSHDFVCKASCLNQRQLFDYAGGNFKKIAIWDMYKGLQVFDKPKELAEFGMERAPQSWCYIKEEE